MKQNNIHRWTDKRGMRTRGRRGEQEEDDHHLGNRSKGKMQPEIVLDQCAYGAGSCTCTF